MKLLLAVDIADRIRDALAGRQIVNVEIEARDLIARHPEAHVAVEDVVATMHQELTSAASRPYMPD